MPDPRKAAELRLFLFLAVAAILAAMAFALFTQGA
jgi:hypothetical protein